MHFLEARNHPSPINCFKKLGQLVSSNYVHIQNQTFHHITLINYDVYGDVYGLKNNNNPQRRRVYQSLKEKAGAKTF